MGVQCNTPLHCFQVTALPNAACAAESSFGGAAKTVVQKMFAGAEADAPHQCMHDHEHSSHDHRNHEHRHHDHHSANAQAQDPHMLS